MKRPIWYRPDASKARRWRAMAAVKEGLDRRRLARSDEERRQHQIPSAAAGFFWPTVRWMAGVLFQDHPIFVTLGTVAALAAVLWNLLELLGLDGLLRAGFQAVMQ